jgi:hypothetical protein
MASFGFDIDLMRIVVPAGKLPRLAGRDWTTLFVRLIFVLHGMVFGDVVVDHPARVVSFSPRIVMPEADTH